MRTLVIGSGAREHAMVWALSRGAAGKPGSLFCAPGNAGTAGLARNLPLDPKDSRAVVAACRELGIGLVVVGPEEPLAAGLVDALAAAGIPAFGPGAAAARLEASKAFAAEFAQSAGVPRARTARFARGDLGGLGRFLEESRGLRLVLKKSGLAAGKGVLESDDPSELRSFGEAVLAADELLAEEYLVGHELSVFALSGGKGYTLLEPAVDHKKALPGNRGPNTGGMGALCPAPLGDRDLMARIEREIVAPSFEAMEARGLSYRGVLFFGVMVTAAGPRLLEYNVRFGDPETQSLLPRLESDFGELCLACARGESAPAPRFSPAKACGLVIAAPGYPISYPKGLLVDLSGVGAAVAAGDPLLEPGELPGGTAGAGSARGPAAFLFHAATGRDAEGGLRTGGGRSFTAVGLGGTWAEARSRALAVAGEVRFEGAWFREDIGEDAAKEAKA